MMLDKGYPIDNPIDRIQAHTQTFKDLAEKYAATEPRKAQLFAELRYWAERYIADWDHHQERLSAKLQAWAEKYDAAFPEVPEVVDTSPSVDLNKGYPPDLQRGRYGMDVANVGAHLDQTIEAPKVQLVVLLRHITDGQRRLLQCTVTDQEGNPKPNIPVALSQWRIGRDTLLFVEKRTDQQGQVEFAVEEEDLPWTSIYVGTVDGKRSIGELSPIEV